MNRTKPLEVLAQENEELRIRLEEAEDTLRAIRNGEIDAVISSGVQGDQVFTLSGADHVYRVMFEQMSESAVTVDLDGQILFANSNFFTLLDLGAEQILGKSLLAFISPPDRELFRSLLQQVILDKSKGEVKLKAANGSELPVLVSLSLLQLDDNPIVAILLTDLREQKRIEKILSSGQLASIILEQAAEAIVVCDPEGAIIRASSQARRLCGQENPIGSNFEDVFPLEVISRSSTNAHQLPEKNDSGWPRFSLICMMDKHVIRSLEVCLKHESKCESYLLLSGRPMQTETAEHLGWVLNLTDITARKQMEDDLLRAKDAADRASRAKSEFLANMSHEIRTPLNGILGILQILQLTAQDLEQKKYILEAIRSSGRLSGLLSDILDLARVESNKIDVREDVFGVNELVESVRESFEIVCKNKNIELVFLCDNRIPQGLVGDEARLRQVLFNLVGNGIKFTEKGSVVVDASMVSNQNDQQCRVLFSVTDTGVGIKDEWLDEMFKPFTQVDGSYARSRQGAGLGLAIVSRLVGLMGGSLCVSSEFGVGTTFFVVMSFQKEILDKKAIAESFPDSLPDDLGAFKILVVEDEDLNRMVAKMLLQKLGHDVETANNGSVALKMIEANNYDLVFMDIQMPVMDGIIATKSIRNSLELKAKANIPIVAMTAHAMSGDREHFLVAGMNDYVSKPIEIQALKDVIVRVMSTKFR
ncbi:response regulator [Desulfovibrio sp. DV]|uniref:response regulator n=2 Tax=Desulfovibrio sp. DV TaxID=1844708 RepID=UPI0020CA19B0|nr:response regulator [Desulfovibrio sp. DV]